VSEIDVTVNPVELPGKGTVFQGSQGQTDDRFVLVHAPVSLEVVDVLKDDVDSRLNELAQVYNTSVPMLLSSGMVKLFRSGPVDLTVDRPKLAWQ